MKVQFAVHLHLLIPNSYSYIHTHQMPLEIQFLHIRAQQRTGGEVTDGIPL